MAPVITIFQFCLLDGWKNTFLLLLSSLVSITISFFYPLFFSLDGGSGRRRHHQQFFFWGGGRGELGKLSVSIFAVNRCDWRCMLTSPPLPSVLTCVDSFVEVASAVAPLIFCVVSLSTSLSPSKLIRLSFLPTPPSYD